MGQTVYYRYVSSPEAQHIKTERRIKSRRSPITYFSPDFYDAADEAYVKLALLERPECRVGPIPADEMPDFDVVALEPVGFVDPNRPGGGVQGATSKEIRLFDIFDFISGSSILSSDTS